MNIYNFDVNFTTGRIYAPDFILVVNDHNSTLFKFTFDQAGRYVFKLLYPDGTIYVQDIADNQLKLTKGVLNQEGNYKFEISLYGEDNRLTTARIKEFPVRLELVSTDEPVQADDRLPILDNLIEETNKVVAAAKNGDFDGATFTPSVSDTGDLSWTNDKGKENPPTVNIAGPPGDPGAVKMQVVDTLPEIGDTDTIYLVKKNNPGEQNLYDEYVYTETTGWEHIGDTSIDLTDYYTKEETDEKIEGLYTLCIERFGGSNPFNVTSDEQVKISTIINDAYVKGLHTINLLIYSKSSSRSMILNIENANIQAKPTSIAFNGLLVVDGLNYKINGLTIYINGTWSNNIFTCTSAMGRWAQNEIYIANSRDYISKTNTTSYTPSGPYNPATKKYVDDNIDAKSIGSNQLVFARSFEDIDDNEITKLFSSSGTTNTTICNWFSDVFTTMFKDKTYPDQCGATMILTFPGNIRNGLSIIFQMQCGSLGFVFNGFSIVDNFMIRGYKLQPTVTRSDNIVTVNAVKITSDHRLRVNSPIDNYDIATKKYVDDNKYTLPVASAETLGGIKLGEGLSADENGVVSAQVGETIPYTYAEYGFFSGANRQITDTVFIANVENIITTYLNKPKTVKRIGAFSDSQSNNTSPVYMTYSCYSKITTSKTSFTFYGDTSSFMDYNSKYQIVGSVITVSGTWNDNQFHITTCNIKGVPNGTVIATSSTALLKNNTTSFTPTGDYNPSTKLYTDKTHYENMTGYDATKTQVLKNINGTLTWVNEG